MSYKMSYKKEKIIFFGLVVLLFLTIITPFNVAGPIEPPPPPPPTGAPVSYTIAYGSYVSGDKEDVYYNEGTYLTVDATVYWFGLDAQVNFYFQDYYFDQVRFDFIDNEPFWCTVKIKVYYRTGNPDIFPSKNTCIRDGYYTYDLDDSRKINYVQIHYENGWFMPNRMQIDFIRLRVA
jgi:hypothetical protein